MGLELLGQVGPQILSDGSIGTLRLGRNAEVVVQELHGQLYEAVKRGNVYAASVAVAGVDHGSSIGTSPPFVLYNPANSGVELSVLLTSLGYVSGTLGAGFIAYVGDGAAAVPSAGSALTPINLKTLQAKGSKASAYSVATVAVAPLLIRPAMNVSAELATTAVGAFMVKDVVNGEILVPQGGYFAMQGVCGAAGTTPRVVFGATWEEVPVGAPT